MGRFGSHSSHDGRYQFQSPRSFMVVGSRNARMIVASTSTALPTMFKGTRS